MPKALKVILPLLILAGAAAAAWHWWPRQEAGNQVTIYGSIEMRQIRLAFQAEGRIADMKAEEGDQVEPGQLLAEVEPERYRDRLARSKAEVAAKEQNLARLLAGSRPQEVERARAVLDEAQANLSRLEKLYRRNRSLFKTKAISRQTLDDIYSQYRAASASVKAAEKRLALVVEGPRVEDIAAARAELAAAKASLGLADKQLADTRLLAPRQAVVQQRVLEPGDMASPSTPVFTLAVVDPVWARAYLPETYLGRVKPGMKAFLLSDSHPGKRYPAWVGFVSPTAEFTPKTVATPELRSKLVYRVRVHACNPAMELRLGMPVSVEIPLDQTGGKSMRPSCGRAE